MTFLKWLLAAARLSTLCLLAAQATITATASADAPIANLRGNGSNDTSGVLTALTYPMICAPKSLKENVHLLLEDDLNQVGYGSKICDDLAKAQQVSDATAKVFSTTAAFATGIGAVTASGVFGPIGSLFSIAGAFCGLFNLQCPKQDPAVAAIKAATAHLDERFDTMETELGELKSDIAAVWLEKFADMFTRMKLRRQYFKEYGNANRSTPAQASAARSDFVDRYTRIDQGGAFDADFVTFHDCFTGENVYCSVDSKVTLFDKVEIVLQHRPQPLMVWASNYQLMMQQGLIAECGYQSAMKIAKNITTDYNCTYANSDIHYTQSLATFMKAKVLSFKQKMWMAMENNIVQCGATNDEFCPLFQIQTKYETAHPGDWNSTVLNDIAGEMFNEMYHNWEYDRAKQDGLYWIGDIISIMIGGQTDFHAIENQKRTCLYRKFSAGSRDLTQILAVIDMSQYPNGYPGAQFKPQVTMQSCLNGYVQACNEQHCHASPEDIANFIDLYCMNGYSVLYVQKMTVDVGVVSTTGGHVHKYLSYLTIGGHDVNIFLL